MTCTQLENYNNIVWYQYNQGFTDAVKRKCKMRDML